MGKWEMIARKMAVLASYGYDMQFFHEYFDDPKFLTEEWLNDFWGKDGLPEYVLDELNAIDLLASNQKTFEATGSWKTE